MKKTVTLLKASAKSLLKNRMRSLLTALGIIIGVGAVITMVSIGQGVRANINDQISSMGANLLTVSPVRARSGGVAQSTSQNTIRPEDADALRELGELAAVSEVTQTSQQVVANGTNWSTTVYGVAPAYLDIRSYELASGRVFTEAEVRARAKVVVIGQTIADELFGTDSPIGAQIRVGAVPATVIGVLDEKGSGGFGGDQDDVVLAPWTMVLYRLSGERTLGSISASATGEDVMTVAEARIRSTLRAQHGLGQSADDDFEIRNQEDILETANEMATTLTLFLGAIAGVSLLVGGIGIMNIMLVSVTERTREIGIRLSVGARGADVLEQFLVEAILLSLVGGLLGVALGIGLTVLVTGAMGLPLVINPAVLVVAAGVSGAIGVFFGYYPARKAAALDPIQALRYE